MDELTAIEVIGCESGFWACALERWGGDLAAWALLLFFLAGCLGFVWITWVRGVLDDRDRLTPRPTARPRVVAGPELRDGSWVRLVEPVPGGQVRAEIYVDRRWQPLHRDPSRFFEAAARSPAQLPRR